MPAATAGKQFFGLAGLGAFIGRAMDVPFFENRHGKGGVAAETAGIVTNTGIKVGFLGFTKQGNEELHSP